MRNKDGLEVVRPNALTTELSQWEEEIECVGYRMRRTVAATAWYEVERTTCYCCSCRDLPYDSHCRNHGWNGVRPCEHHGTPGASGEDGMIPDTVQQELSRRSGIQL
jgi:hypothetical protein